MDSDRPVPNPLLNPRPISAVGTDAAGYPAGEVQLQSCSAGSLRSALNTARTRTTSGGVLPLAVRVQLHRRRFNISEDPLFVGKVERFAS